MFIFVTVLDKEHFSPKKKISFKLPQKMATSRPSKIPVSQKSPGSQDHHELSITNPTLLPSNTSSSNSEQLANQIVDSLTSDKKVRTILNTSAASNELSSSLHTNGAKSIDSGFADEKNKQEVDIQSLPFTCTTVEVANAEDTSSHIEAKCFMPLEEVDQGITRTASQGSLASTTTSTSLEEMVGDECSSSGGDCVGMPKVIGSHDWTSPTQLNRPRSACDDYIIHDLVSDQKMKRHDSLPQLESSPNVLASKINLLQNEKVLLLEVL